MPKQPVRIVVGLLFIVLGALHFVRPGFYTPIMPPYFPAPLFWVLLSGVLEVLGGLGLPLRRFRRRAAYGLALLMVAFLPVHLHMLFCPADVGAEAIAPFLLFWRLAFQFVLIVMFVWLAEDA
ncbi:MAG: hypothetical protein AVDCRST_MAG86-681 [uncultured Truepera sp.]|uniref:DoxX family protein n=1 Tax=uncultured Truepera sp. TaxID=543023 RepID=A0A6J4UWC4_9DEIN|nr:MAG: hypothetical protein AVDCRST_MAG86-681 [uncultured Truepera sp.]